MHQLQILTLNLLDHHAQNLLTCLFLLGQEHQSRTILSFLGHGDALQQNKLMRNLHHDTCTVTCLVASLGASVLHILQHLQCIVHQLMAFSTVDVHHHTHATSVVFIVWLIQSLKFAFCHIILTFTNTLFDFVRKGNTKRSYSKPFTFFSDVENNRYLHFARKWHDFLAF